MLLVVEENKQNPSSNLGGYFPMKSPELTKWILSPEEVISNIEMWLKGAIIKYDSEGVPKLVHDKKKERLNEEGRRLVLTPLLAMLNKNAILSDIDNRNIGEITEATHWHLAETLFKSWRKIGVQSPTDIPPLIDLISSNVFFALNRAKKGITLKEISHMHVTHENITGNKKDEGAKKFGLFG